MMGRIKVYTGTVFAAVALGGMGLTGIASAATAAPTAQQSMAGSGGAWINDAFPQGVGPNAADPTSVVAIGSGNCDTHLIFIDSPGAVITITNDCIVTFGTTP
jgi:hypothetical protein